MAVEFLSDEQAGAFGRFTGEPSRAELERFFYLDDEDRRLIDKRRGAHNRLGFAVQLGTVRFLGTFLADPLDVPWAVVDYLGAQLGLEDVSEVKRYARRPATQWEHAAEIRDTYGYVDFTAGEGDLRGFLEARAWTRSERPSALFDHAVTWLRAGRVLLPGVSVLARLVAEVRAHASARLYESIAEQIDVELGGRLDGLLTVPDGTRSSELDRLRRAPVRASGPEMVRALDRAAEVAALGAGAAALDDVPPGRLQALARHGLGADVWTLRRMTGPRRNATMLATARALEISAVDDALDLFAVLMTTKLIGAARRAVVKDKLKSLPQLERASVTLAVAGRELLRLVDAAGDHSIDPATAWAQLQAVVPRDRLAQAVATVGELAPDDTDSEAGQRAELVKRYATVRPFLPMLADVLPLDSTEAGRPVLDAVNALAGLTGRKKVQWGEVAAEVVTGSWVRLVFANPDLGEGVVDVRAYTLCVLEGLHRGLRRRDVYATGSARWGDPRAKLLDGPAWGIGSSAVKTSPKPLGWAG